MHIKAKGTDLKLSIGPWIGLLSLVVCTVLGLTALVLMIVDRRSMRGLDL